MLMQVALETKIGCKIEIQNWKLAFKRFEFGKNATKKQEI